MPPLQGADMRRPWMDQAFHRNGGVLDTSGADLSGSVHPSLTPCSNEAVIRGRKPALCDGKGSWQDYKVQFEMLAAACGWDDRQKAIELATSYGTKESECWPHLPSVKGKTMRIPCG